MIFTQTSSAAEQVHFADRVHDVLLAVFYSPFFSVVKFLLAIYITVIIVDVIMLLVLGGTRESYRKNKRGANLPTQTESRRKWRRIIERLDKNDQDYYKAAILEADQMVESVLFDAGYTQDTMVGKLNALDTHLISSASGARIAHALSVRVVREADLILSREETEAALGQYEKLLTDLEIFG